MSSNLRSQNLLPVDSIKLTVANFIGDEDFIGEIRLQQIAEIFTAELNQFTLPVLSLEERDQRVELISNYQGDIDIEERYTEQHPRPDYWCRGIITEESMTIKITNFEDEKVIVQESIATKNSSDKRIRLLARQAALALIEGRNGYDYDQANLISIRLPNGTDYAWSNLPGVSNKRTLWFPLSSNRPELKLTVQYRNEPQSISAVRGVENNFLQHWKIKRGAPNKNSLTPARLQLATGVHYFSHENRSSSLFYGQCNYFLSAKWSIGLALNTYRLPYSTQVQVPDFSANPINEEEYLLSPSILTEYQHYSSAAKMFFGGQLGAAPFEKGGNALVFAGWPKLSWLRLEAGGRSFTTDIPAYSFRPGHLLAQRYFTQERFFLWTLGLRISTSL